MPRSNPELAASMGMRMSARRRELGLTQEMVAELAGIAHQQYNKAENGKSCLGSDSLRKVSAALQISSDYLLTGKSSEGKYSEVISLLDGLTDQQIKMVQQVLQCMVRFHAPTKIDKQFVLLHEILINEAKYTNEERLEQLEAAIQLTCPKYKNGFIPQVLSYDEIILLNNIAICHHVEGDSAQAIRILTSLKDYFDHHMISAEEALRTQPMVLYNLSKYLGLNGRYDECIEICDMGIRIARATGRCPLLGETLFNRAWALIQRNRAGDIDVAKKTLKDAIYFSCAIDNQQNIETMQDFYRKTFGESISV